MLQEKYNQMIYDAADDATTMEYYHTRCNILEIIGIEKNDSVLLLGKTSKVMEEWVENYATKAESSCDCAVLINQLAMTPKELKGLLKSGGRVVFAGQYRDFSISVIKALFEEAGFSTKVVYQVKPDIYFATEFIIEGSDGANVDSYIIIFE